MIVWINGAYGAGKSTVAEELARRLPGALIFDAEAVGNAVRDNLEPVDYHVEFPDYALWREFVGRLLTEMAQKTEAHIFVPMTVLREDYMEEILGRLEERGLTCRHFVLELPPDVIRERVLARGETPAHWCYQQAERCPALLKELGGIHLDASPSVERVAEEIIGRL